MRSRCSAGKSFPIRRRQLATGGVISERGCPFLAISHSREESLERFAIDFKHPNEGREKHLLYACQSWSHALSQDAISKDASVFALTSSRLVPSINSIRVSLPA